ncbi:sulfite exporter TauE/SafE family protein [Pseudomonas sp. s4]|uniref:sulfite exporter TauE/SafE family protein n=1 Tax=Pseudomonas sp. s4 TaxID=353218 RepID=UPI00398D4B63
MLNLALDFFFGILMGALGGFFGIGGGLVAIPLMTLILGLSQTMAQGTALVMMVPNVALALWRYQQRSPISWSLALPLATMGFITAGFGARAAVHVDPLHIRTGFAVLMLGLAVLTLFRNRISHRDSTPKAQPSPLRLGALGSGCGVLGGFFGVGASVVAVPVLTGVFGLSQLAAQGMALTLALPSTVITLATYCWNGHVDWTMGLAMATGGLLSVGWGVKWAYRVHERHLRILFAIFLVVSATMLLIKG